MHRESIAVDLDGCLAHYDHFRGDTHIGKPIPAMVQRVKDWISEGKDVEIFTARAHKPAAVEAIKDWCKTHLGKVLKVTNKKKPKYASYWDDRAVTVQRNTGSVLTKKSKARHLIAE